MNNNEPIILGKVKKGKTEKAIIVLIVFLFIGSIIFFSQIIINYFEGYNVIELIKKGDLIDYLKDREEYKNNLLTTTTKKVIKNEPVLINNKAILTYNNFTLSSFKIETDKVSFKVKTSNNINFDKSNYYLVLSKNNKEIKTLKLIGEIKGEKDITLLFNKKIENTIEVKGIIKEIKKIDYPKVSLKSDETGAAEIICTNNENSIEYVFYDNRLNSLVDSFTYIDKNDGEYFNILKKYTNLTEELKNIGAVAYIIEQENKFIMKTSIDLTQYQFDLNKNTNYYELNTEPKIIKFEMEAKGFECK